MPGNECLITAFQEMENERIALQDAVAGVDVKFLSVPSPNGSWSAAQLICHLAMAEEAALAYLGKKVRHGGHGPVGVLSSLRLLALRMAFALPIRWRAPSIIADVPLLQWDQALERWNTVRLAWRGKLAELPPALATHDLFKHPSAGKISLLQGMRFMASHVRHHRAQMHRILGRYGD